MIGRIFLTEARRSFKITLTLILCSFLSGFTLSSGWKLKTYIENLFIPVSWNANLIVLPKSVDLEGLHRSLLHSPPEGLIPMALFETLQGQIQQEKIQYHLAEPSLKILGFIPFEDASGKIHLAYSGDKEAYFANSPTDSIWNQFSFDPWTSHDSELAARPGYQTPEWGSKTLMGILAKGEPGPIEKLKELIDRKTIGQGVRVTPGLTNEDQRLHQLGKSLYALVALIGICLIPGLFLSMIVLLERRRVIFTVLKELGEKPSHSLRLTLLQSLFLILLPMVLGLFLGLSLAPLIESLLKFS